MINDQVVLLSGGLMGNISVRKPKSAAVDAGADEGAAADAQS
ncbi:hypothetical protein [Streptomyces sp. NA04227]|nr:hypothetical protein [Streptomyces sp. NA04227]